MQLFSVTSSVAAFFCKRFRKEDRTSSSLSVANWSMTMAFKAKTSFWTVWIRVFNAGLRSRSSLSD